MQLRKISVLFKDYEMYKERYTPTELKKICYALGDSVTLY